MMNASESPYRRTPCEMVVRNQVREASVGVQLVLEHVTHGPAIERSVLVD